MATQHTSPSPNRWRPDIREWMHDCDYADLLATVIFEDKFKILKITNKKNKTIRMVNHKIRWRRDLEAYMDDINYARTLEAYAKIDDDLDRLIHGNND